VLKYSLQQAYDYRQSLIDFSTGVSAVIAVIAGPSAPIAVPIIWAAWQLLSTALIDVLDPADDALADNAYWSNIACGIYCVLADQGGQLTPLAMTRIVDFLESLDSIYDSFDPTASIDNILGTYLTNLGAATITINMQLGILTAYDCSFCDCVEPPEPCPEIVVGVTTFTSTGGFSFPSASSFSNANLHVQGDSAGPYGVGASSELIITLPQERCITGIGRSAQGSSAGLWTTAQVFVDNIYVMDITINNTAPACNTLPSIIYFPSPARGTVIKLVRLTGNPGSLNYQHSFKCISYQYIDE